MPINNNYLCASISRQGDTFELPTTSFLSNLSMTHLLFCNNVEEIHPGISYGRKCELFKTILQTVNIIVMSGQVGIKSPIRMSIHGKR